MFELLNSLCAETLHLLPTSVAEDEAQLAAVPEEQQRLRLALTWRNSYKQCGFAGLAPLSSSSGSVPDTCCAPCDMLMFPWGVGVLACCAGFCVAG